MSSWGQALLERDHDSALTTDDDDELEVVGDGEVPEILPYGG